MNESQFYVVPETKKLELEWSRFPSELRPHRTKKRTGASKGAANPAKVARKSVGDISKHLDKLEQSERADKSKRDDDSDKEDKVGSTSANFILFPSLVKTSIIFLEGKSMSQHLGGKNSLLFFKVTPTSLSSSIEQRVEQIQHHSRALHTQFLIGNTG